MPTRARTLSLLLLAPVALTLACDEKDDTGPVEACDAVANAGEDLALSFGDTANLNGCPPDWSVACNGVEYTYVWTIESVPVESDLSESLLSDNNSDTACQTSFVPDTTGTYVLSMVMNDGAENSAADLVIVEVTSGNQAPIADCGDDLRVDVGERAELDGTGSSDPEGAALEYAWALSSWPEDSSLGAEDIYNAGGAHPTVIPDVAGLYLASLVVSDGTQWSDPAYCTITAVSENQPPVADAGVGSTLPACADSVIELNAYGSYDPEGATLSYLWDVLQVPAGSHADGSLDSGDTGPAGAPAFDDPTSPTPSFTWDVMGTYIFQLSVHDGTQWSAPDVVSYVVPDPATNSAPTANAGSDFVLETESECELVSYGVHECDPCEAETFDLDGTASIDPNGDELAFYWSEATGELTLHTPFQVLTQATTPELAASLTTPNTSTWTVNLDVSDCMYSDNDSVTITLTCVGSY